MSLKQMQALEQPEPMECHTCKGLGRIYMGCGSWIHCDTCNTTGKATIPPKRESEPPSWTPVEIGVDVTPEGAHVVGMYVLMPDAVRYVFYSQFHSAPKRKPLTDEEIDELWDETVKYAPSEVRIRDFARAIEAKLKEKNT